MPRRALVAALSLLGCSAPERFAWLDTAELGDAHTLITVVEDPARIRRALAFDPAAPLLLPERVEPGGDAHVEIHALRPSLAELGLSAGLIAPAEGLPLPAPLSSWALDVNRGARSAWRPTDSAAIADIRVPSPCARYHAERRSFPAELAGVAVNTLLAIDAQTLLITFENGAVLSYRPSEGLRPIQRDWTTPIGVMDLSPSGTIFVGDDAHDLSECRLEGDRLVRLESTHLSEFIFEIAAMGSAPMEATVVLFRTETSRDVLRVQPGRADVLEAEGDLYLRAVRRGQDIFVFGQRTPQLRRVVDTSLEVVPTPPLAGISALDLLPGRGLLIGTSDALVFERDALAPGGWRSFAPLGNSQPGTKVEQLLPFEDRFLLTAIGLTASLIELLPNQTFCTPLEHLDPTRILEVGGELVQKGYPEGWAVIVRN